MLVQKLRLAAHGHNIGIRVEAGGAHANTHLAWIRPAGPLAELLAQQAIDVHANQIVPSGRPRYRQHFTSKIFALVFGLALNLQVLLWCQKVFARVDLRL